MHIYNRFATSDIYTYTYKSIYNFRTSCKGSRKLRTARPVIIIRPLRNGPYSKMQGMHKRQVTFGNKGKATKGRQAEDLGGNRSKSQNLGYRRVPDGGGMGSVTVTSPPPPPPPLTPSPRPCSSIHADPSLPPGLRIPPARPWDSGDPQTPNPPPPRPAPAAAAPQPGPRRSPAPVCGSGAAPALPAARSSNSGSGSSDTGGPGISPTARPHGADSRFAFRGSVCLVRPSCLSGTRAGCSWTHVASAKPQSGSFGQTSFATPAALTPSFPPACNVAAAASQQQQRQQLCGAAGPGGRAPAAMMGCVM
jgi:hypothetical protein